MKSPKAPPPPDPVATASAQGAANVATGTANQTINMVDQYTPEGSLQYEQIGSVTIPNGLGGTYQVPRYKATQTLSPEQKELYDTGLQTERNIAGIGRDQSARIGSLLGTPININNEATEARLMELGSKRLNPRFAQEEEALRTRLANSGIRAGSAAYDAEMRGFNEGKNDAYNSLLLSGRGQAVQEALTERNQPINEISALLSQSQVSQPNFVNSPQTQVAGVDYAGMVQQGYQNQMDAWKQKQAKSNAALGAIAGIGSSALMMFSDRRLKTEIKKVGKLDNGLPVYSYRYKMGGPMQIGVMAQDVEKTNPDAVERHESGYRMVDYAEAVEG